MGVGGQDALVARRGPGQVPTGEGQVAETAQGLVLSALAVDDTQLALAAAEFSRELGDIAERMDEVLA